MHLKKPNRFFVTATDTNSGKTTITQILITSLQQQNFCAVGCKPIACGLNEAGQNEDVIAYQKVNSLPLPKSLLNPLCYQLPASPNIAAEAEQSLIEVDDLVNQLATLADYTVDFIFYEGIGGWKVPLNHTQTTVDFVRAMQLPIIFVVGIKVGCLNHALLTLEAINKDKLPIAGWIANVIDPDTPAISEHIATLQQWTAAPYLGKIPFGATASYELNLTPLINYV